MMRAVLAVCASAVLGLSIAAGGCESDYDPGPESGGSKGPEMMRAPSGQPASPSASAMSPGSPPPSMTFPSAPCGEGLTCAGATACMSACDPIDQLVTSCARCEAGAFTDCTDHPCP
jgi:hypothetical protein